MKFSTLHAASPISAWSPTALSMPASAGFALRQQNTLHSTPLHTTDVLQYTVQHTIGPFIRCFLHKRAFSVQLQVTEMCGGKI